MKLIKYKPIIKALNVKNLKKTAVREAFRIIVKNNADSWKLTADFETDYVETMSRRLAPTLSRLIGEHV